MSRGVRKGSTNPAKCDPPEGLTTLRIRVVGDRMKTERTISSLSEEAFAWLGRIWLAEHERRAERKMSVDLNA